jgi:hypothetical protein
MGFLDRIKSLLSARSSAAPASEQRLSAQTTSDLSASIGKLSSGARGWISQKKAGSFFSQMGDEFAFGEQDKRGRSLLESFIAKDLNCSGYELAPAAKRVYFNRK